MITPTPPSHGRSDRRSTSIRPARRRSRHPSAIQDHPLTLGVVMTPEVIRRIVTDNSFLRDAGARGLARPGKDLCAAPAIQAVVGSGSCRSWAATAAFPRFEMERGADGAMTGYAFPDMLVDVVASGRPAGAIRRTTCLTRFAADPIRAAAGRGSCRARIRDEDAPHDFIACDAQRKPGATITATAKAEVDYLLSRVARVDKRANLQPQASAAE